MEKHKNILQVVTYFTAAVSNTRLYAADHPQVGRYLQKAKRQLNKILQFQPDLTFLIVDDDLVVDNHALTGNTPQLEQFAALLRRCAIERISFSREVSVDGLLQLVDDLSAAGAKAVHSAPGITLGKVKVLQEADTQARPGLMTPEVQDKLAALELYRDRSLDDIRDLYQQIKSSKQISRHGLGEIVMGFLQGMLYSVNPLELLASLKSWDEYTFTHAINVCILTMAQAEALGIKGDMLYDIGIAASMHDAGKMFVSDDILNKPDKLTDEEWEHMRQHSAQGARYILKLEGIPKLAFLAALEHHIRYDGSGYPNLGKKWRPNIVSQMIAIADMFDAMRSRRPYKDPKPDEIIIKILKAESGTTFHPELTRNFLRLIKG